MKEVDVLVVGAGPAGAAAALNLASRYRVLMLDCRERNSTQTAFGECLAPAARRLLSDMGLFDSFVAENHSPCYGSRSVWGHDYAVETDFVRDLDGHGWHLDRGRFDTWLRAAAVERGALLISPSLVHSVQPKPSGQGWQTRIEGLDPDPLVHAGILIDATGKFALLARRLGAKRETTEERLSCFWTVGVALETSGTAGFTMVEAVEDGWWYSAPLPAGRRALAFHTAPDLPASRLLRSPGDFLRLCEGTTLLAAALRQCRFSPVGERLNGTVANGGVLSPAAGHRWFAAGDAAIHFDPLSSQGLLNALFTGLASAEAADRVLRGEGPHSVAGDYQAIVQGIQEYYRPNLRQWYRMEDRWPTAPFWAPRREQ